VWKCTGDPLAATASHIGFRQGSHNGVMPPRREISRSGECRLGLRTTVTAILIRIPATCRGADRPVARLGQFLGYRRHPPWRWSRGSARAVVCAGLLGDAEQLEAMDLEVRPPGLRLPIEAQHIASRITKPSSDLGRIGPDRLSDLPRCITTASTVSATIHHNVNEQIRLIPRDLRTLAARVAITARNGSKGVQRLLVT
jgi:hypothetical protein